MSVLYDSPAYLAAFDAVDGGKWLMGDYMRHLEELENLLREACEVANIEFHEAKFAPADLADRIVELETLILETARDLEPHIRIEAERDRKRMGR